MNLAISVCALVLIPSALLPASLPVLSLEGLASRSDVMVKGRVVRTWAALDPENRFIWTHYEVRVDRTFKGPVQSTIEIAEPGGSLNGITHLIPGSTAYAVGEAIGVFLYRTPIGYLRTTNYGQGKFLRSADGRVSVNHHIDVAGASIASNANLSSGGTRVEGLDGADWFEFELRVSRIVASQEGVRQ